MLCRSSSVADEMIFAQNESLLDPREKNLRNLHTESASTIPDSMTIRDDFFSVQVPETAIHGMGRIIEQARVFGLKAWFDSLDAEFVTDLVASWEVWNAQQAPRRPEVPLVPEEPVSPHGPVSVPPTNGRRLRVKFKTPRLRRSLS